MLLSIEVVSGKITSYICPFTFRSQSVYDISLVLVAMNDNTVYVRSLSIHQHKLLSSTCACCVFEVHTI